MKTTVSNLLHFARCALWVAGLTVVCAGTVNRAHAGPDHAASKAVVFREQLPGFDQELAQEIAARVQAAGYQVEFAGLAVLTNPARLTASNYDLLVVTGAGSLPANTMPAVESYLRQGGDLLALGVPAWESPLFQLQGRWVSRKEYDQTIGSQPAQHLVEAFPPAKVSDWTRASSEPKWTPLTELITTEYGKALHVKISHFNGWENLVSPPLKHPFPPGQTLTCFRAKGGPHTPQLAVEWMEEDGSRWIATVSLTPEWKQYAVPLEAFQAWQPPPGRGGRGDHLNPQKASRFTVGLALTHTALEGEQHEYWFADLGTAPNPFGSDAPPLHLTLPRLESLSPGYQVFPITTPVVVRSDTEKAPLEDWEQQLEGKAGGVAGPCLGLHPRPRAVGFDQERPFRWEPLLGGYDEKTHDYRGALGALVVHVEKPFRGGAWAVFTPDNVEFYRQPVVTHCLHQTLTRMRRGIFLTEGGSEFFTVFAGQRFKVGARVANFGKAAISNLCVTVEFENANGSAKHAAGRWRFDLAPGAVRALEQEVGAQFESRQAVETRLTLGGTDLDALRHEFGVWRPKTKPDFVEAHDGHFWLHGKRWKVNGVNYMPSTGIGVTSAHFFEHWLGRGSYDPTVIERDLRRIKAMNLNAVSIFIYYESLEAQNLLDFLRRCEALGLHVNQSLRPGTPMDFRWDEMKALIEHYRLAENSTVFAYDLAWEPSHGNTTQQQKAYGDDWRDWVRKRYGSVAAAESAWGVPAPRLLAGPSSSTPPSLAVPPMSQLVKDGPWRKLVADYRAFLDDELGRKYSAARRLVKSIDPHHAVSFRMSCAGDPSLNWDAFLPYDFYGLADAVDIWEPEAYGRIGDWDKVKAGAFTAAYARLCDPSKPLMWAEMGYNVWDRVRMAPNPQKLAFEGRYYADFYRMLRASDADGVFFWWYPGGFRVGENSDFGIINPDGTDRPATRVIRTQGPRLLGAPTVGKPDYWIAVDRDQDSRGLFAMYEAAKDEFWKAIAEGHRPGLKWARLPGAGFAGAHP